ncbi:MAG: MgtC/SapB family protein, partial [Patescibacteria group bacterium]
MIYLSFFGVLLLALLLGALIGWQREHIGKAAGLRTYALVSFGSALFTILSMQAIGDADPGRVAAQILTGIGFIGAGVIIHKHDNVEGLTTAAGLWATSAVGMAVGAGWYIHA